MKRLPSLFLGLIVNLASAWLLQEDHHGHSHYGDRKHDRHHRDSNLKAAYIHVVTDALTSVLAIVALYSGKYLGWIWLDPVMGLVGAAVISKWSYGLVRDTGVILLDGAIDKQIKLEIMTAIEADGDSHITDLHLWYIGQNHLSAIIAIVTYNPRSPEYYKSLLNKIPSLVHVTVEVNYALT